MHLRPALFCLALTTLVPLQSHAASGIFGFVDEDGVEHLSNIPDDKRYRMVLADRFEPARTALRAPRGVFALPYGQRPFHDSVMRASSGTSTEGRLLACKRQATACWDTSRLKYKGSPLSSPARL